MSEGQLVDWLLGGDVAVAFQTARDLLGQDRPELQARIATEGHGAALLAARGANGHWGRGFYQPKWTSSHYTLLELKNLGLSPGCEPARETVQLILRREKSRDGGLNPTATVAWSDACVNGMALGYSAYFGAEQEQLTSIVDFLLDQRVPDGGFNCRWNKRRRATTHSSVHTTLSVMEGITEYVRRGYRYRADELAEAVASGVQFFLRHRLYRSHRSGEPMRPQFTRLHHPARWYFDILRCLDAFADAGIPYDERMDDALDVLRARHRPDGRWAVAAAYPGVTHVPPTPAGQPDRWVTLLAMRALSAYSARAPVVA
ncbi:MAG: hypothetical protein ACOYBY_04075 [Dermatophilaceae bacterium]